MCNLNPRCIVSGTTNYKSCGDFLCAPICVDEHPMHGCFHIQVQRKARFFRDFFCKSNIIASMGEVVKLQLEVAGVSGPTRCTLFSSFVVPANLPLLHRRSARPTCSRASARRRRRRARSTRRTTRLQRHIASRRPNSSDTSSACCGNPAPDRRISAIGWNLQASKRCVSLSHCCRCDSCRDCDKYLAVA
jgi:hypothetical protein